MENKVLEYLEKISLDMSEMKEDIKSLKTDVAILKSDVAILKSDVSILKSDVEILKSDVSILKSDVEILKSDVETLKCDVTTLKSDMTTMKSDVATLKSDVEILTSDVSNLKLSHSKLEQKVDLMREEMKTNFSVIHEVIINSQNINDKKFKEMEATNLENNKILTDAVKSISNDVLTSNEYIITLAEITGRHELDISVLKKKAV